MTHKSEEVEGWVKVKDLNDVADEVGKLFIEFNLLLILFDLLLVGFKF